MSSHSPAGPASQEQHGKLHQVHCGPRVQTLFIVVPGVGTLPPRRWSDGHGDIWLRSIRPESAVDVGIFTFHSESLTAGTPFGWAQVEAEGAAFLGALYHLIQINELHACPIVLFAHSFGGMILKRALSIAYRDAQRFRILLRNISAVVLLASPHSQLDTVKTWENVPTILKTYSKAKSKYAVTREMAAGLAADSLCFEQVVEHTPVITLFEMLETRVAGYFGPKVLLVDERFATTNTRNEHIIGVKADHNDICCLNSSNDQLGTITALLDRAVQDTLKIIRRVSEEFVRPPAFEKSTIGAKTSAGSLHEQYMHQDVKKRLPFNSEAGITEEDVKVGSLSEPAVTTIHKLSAEGTAGSTAASFQIIPSLADFSTTKVDPQLPCHVIPLSQNAFFQSRTDVLETLSKALVAPVDDSPSSENSDDGRHLRTFALCGPGGMGKTSIATEFVHRYRAMFDAIFWIHADGLSKLAVDFSSNAVALGLVAGDSPEARDQILTRDLLLGWLANPVKSYQRLEDKRAEEATWLLVFDNVDNPDVLDDYWPADSSGSVLVTSRDPLVKNYLYSRHGGMTLTPLSIPDATKLLLSLTGRKRQNSTDQSAATAVATILGGYPLAISQMAGVIARRDLTFSEFLDLYQKDSARADLFKLQIGPAKARAGYDHTVASVWALEDLKDGSSLLDILSMLDPDGVPEYILEDNPGSLSSQGCPYNSAQYQLARTELLQSSLVTREKDTKRLMIHRLIQDAARAKMSDKCFNGTYSVSLCMLSAVWPYEAFSFGNEMYRWARCEELYPHVLRLQTLYSRFCPPSELTAAHLEGPKLFLDAAWNSIMRARYAETPPLLDIAQEMCEMLQKGAANSRITDPTLNDHLETLLRLTYNHRGSRTLHTNEPEVSLTNFEIFHNMVQAKFGKEAKGGTDQSLGVSWNELGNAVLQNNDSERAVDCFKKSIEALESLDGATRISISMPLINLGFAYWTQGKLDKAAEIFHQALRDREDEYGENDKTSFVTGKLLLGYGNVKLAQGYLDESFSLHQRCLLQYKSTVGNNHHRTADGCIKVSDHYVRLQQWSPALAVLDQAIKIYGDQKHFISEWARANYKRGKLLDILGKTEEARVDLDLAMKLYKEMCPQDNRAVNDLQDEDFDKRIMFWSR